MASTLRLVCESKICELIPCENTAERWEASGISVKDGHYLVVFDDRTEIARIANDMKPNSANGLFGMAHAVSGCEGITYNADMRRYYLLVESRKYAKGRYKALIVEYDEEFRYLKERPVDFEFESGKSKIGATGSATSPSAKTQCQMKTAHAPQHLAAFRHAAITNIRLGQYQEIAATLGDIADQRRKLLRCPGIMKNGLALSKRARPRTTRTWP